jgi:flagellar biosynthesis activator protein FlaF
MYQELYEDIAGDATQRIRDDERRAFNHSIVLLKKAQEAAPGSRESVEAIYFLNRLWGVLLEDLASPENALPKDLRARLISIGIWMLRYAEDIRRGAKSDFAPLIEISENICKGLRPAA